jgi:hypothetical protein
MLLGNYLLEIMFRIEHFVVGKENMLTNVDVGPHWDRTKMSGEVAVCFFVVVVVVVVVYRA